MDNTLNSGVVAGGPLASDGRSALVAWSVAFVLGLAVIGAGLVAEMSLPILGWAAMFLFFAVANDLRSHRVPNLLTLPALVGALVVSPWVGATSGPLEAVIGAAMGFVLLVGPYSLGGLGGGDVKALMVLGAWVGPVETLGVAAWALIAAGAFSVALLASQRELADFARRWRRNLVTTLILRKLEYEPPAPDSSAASGIPFAAALAVGLTVQWLGGPPW